MVAQLALEEYRATKAEEYLSDKRAALLRGTLIPARNTRQTMKTVSLLTEPRVTISAKYAEDSTKLVLREVSSPRGVPSLYSLLRSGGGVQSRYLNKDKPRTLSQQPPRSETTSMSWDGSLCFPSKLFAMLEEAEREGHSDMISFLPNGKVFMIHKPKLFARSVLPKYFRTDRLSSFQKQLSLYGFKRVKFGAIADYGAYQHKFFRRDDKKLVAKIERKRQGRVLDREPMKIRADP